LSKATYIEHPRLMCLSWELKLGPPALQGNTLCKEPSERSCTTCREREQGAQTSEQRENCITSGSPLCRGLTSATYILCIEHLRLMRLSIGNRTRGKYYAKSHLNGVINCYSEPQLVLLNSLYNEKYKDVLSSTPLPFSLQCSHLAYAIVARPNWNISEGIP